jgi:hypothetical protein
MTDQDLYIVHQHPVWRERVNFIVHAELPEPDLPKQFEQLWTRQVGPDEFEICCIPFFIFDVNLADIVRAVPKAGHPTSLIR